MASIYLLESSATYGYELEDGSGRLLLESSSPAPLPTTGQRKWSRFIKTFSGLTHMLKPKTTMS